MWLKATTPQDLVMEKERNKFLTDLRTSIQQLITMNLSKKSPITECNELCLHLENVFIFGAKNASKIWSILCEKTMEVHKDKTESDISVSRCPIRTFLNTKVLGDVVQYLITDPLVKELYEDYAILRDVESQQLFCSLVNGLQFLDFEIPYRTISDVKQVVDRVQKSMSQDREEFNNVQESSHARPSRKRNKVPIQ